MRRKILSLTLALVMCLGLFPVFALAAEEEFVIEGGVLTKYNGSGGNVTIPDNVTSIGYGAFRDCTGLTSVAIGNGVTEIGMSAFYDCTRLISVTIPDSVTEIGEGAFMGCTRLTSVTIPNSVTEIGGFAFNETPWLTSQGEFPVVNGILLKYQGSGGTITIPDSVTKIGERAFEACTGLKSVTISNGVTRIGETAFSDCTNLTSVTISSSVTEIGGYAFAGCTGLTNVTIGNSVATIGNGAFYNCTRLTSVIIPNSVTEIGMMAFDSCTRLTDVTIGNSVTTIGDSAFTDCTSLTSVIIPNNVEKIDRYTFQNCTKLTSVTIPNSVTEIGFVAFDECTSLTDVYFAGNQEQWESITVNNEYNGNDALKTATIHYNSPMPEVPASPTLPTVENIPASGTAVETRQTIMLDGAAKEFQCYAIMNADGNGTNYIKIRDLAYALNGTGAQFNVSWDGKIAIQSNTAYQPNGSENTIAYAGSQAYESISNITISFNGQDINLTAINIQGGNTYYKLRDLGQLLNFNVKWDAAAGRVAIESNKPYDPND